LETFSFPKQRGRFGFPITVSRSLRDPVILAKKTMVTRDFARFVPCSYANAQSGPATRLKQRKNDKKWKWSRHLQTPLRFDQAKAAKTERLHPSSKYPLQNSK
jgi:hypothetical protein